MKILLGVFVVIVLAASIFADYKWRQWMAARRRDREGSNLPPDLPLQ